MAGIIYSLAIHPQCIEGIRLLKRHERIASKAEYSSAFLAIADGVTLEERLENFLETHRWGNQQISLIIPSEEVSFRVLHFPFQDKKKIRMALPFEIESEVLTGKEESNYQYVTQILPDGRSRVFLYIISKAYLQMLIRLCARHDLTIRNIDCAAHKLFKSVPSSGENSPRFQVYLGVEECFINVIENQHLQAIKVFPSRLATLLKEFPELRQVDRLDFCRSILQAPRISGSAKKSHPTSTPGSLIRAEIQTLCFQLNLFARTWNFHEPPRVSFHGLLGVLLEWDGASFKLHDAETTPKTNPGDSNSRSNARVRKPGDGTPSHPRDIESHLSAFTTHWGILGELKKYGLRHLPEHDLSFYSQGTPLVRFLRKHRLKLVMCGVFFILMAGSMSASYFLELRYLEKKIARTEFQIAGKLRQLLPHDSTTDVGAAIKLLRSRVAQKKEAREETRFDRRRYPVLEFIKEISAALPDDDSFTIKSMELNNSRFRVTGNASNYQDLEHFTKRLSVFEEFKDKRLLPDFRKGQNEIFYTITINRQP